MKRRVVHSIGTQFISWICKSFFFYSFEKWYIEYLSLLSNLRQTAFFFFLTKCIKTQLVFFLTRYRKLHCKMQQAAMRPSCRSVRSPKKRNFGSLNFTILHMQMLGLNAFFASLLTEPSYLVSVKYKIQF